MRRRSFIKAALQATAMVPGAAIASRLGALEASRMAPAEAGDGTTGRAPSQSHAGVYAPARIANDYSLWLPGEREALANTPAVAEIGADYALLRGTAGRLNLGDRADGWELVAVVSARSDGSGSVGAGGGGGRLAVFERDATHQGVFLYVSENGVAAAIPKRVGYLGNIRPRPISAPAGARVERPARYIPGPDRAGDYVLNSNEDPCYENVAALGPELIGWTLVGNEESGPLGSLFLEADGRSRQFPDNSAALWAPDQTGRRFDPADFLPSEYLYDYVQGYSKRTLLGGFLPVADIGVWNPTFGTGYEATVLLPAGAQAKPMARIRATIPGDGGTLIPSGDTNAQQQLPRPRSGSSKRPRSFDQTRYVSRYWQSSAERFFGELLKIWRRWSAFYEPTAAAIPDPWLLDAARAGITLCRCSYRGLNPTYQIGEGAYTKIPERSHALFPVAHYEFVWAHQLWGLAKEVEPYFEHYLDRYVLPDGNFLYNTQDQVEAPLNVGVFLENSARAYDYTLDAEALARRLPVLRRMAEYVLERYRWSKRQFPAGDPRRGLIWGSPEADKGDPKNDTPEAHPYYFQNATWTWRGLTEHARCLRRAAAAASKSGEPVRYIAEAENAQRLADEMRADIERSLAMTLAARNPAMKRAGITPFHPFDTERQPAQLSSYENHRYMMDFWTSDWGVRELDEGHMRHRLIAGEQMLGMNTDGDYPRTSNFMEHGTLAMRIRQPDYRPFLMSLYGNACYAMDCGNRYAPEDALLPGNYPGEGSPYAWSAVVNSELQIALGLRWLLCFEEHDNRSSPGRVHLQKAAPKHWFASGEEISVAKMTTRWGSLSWKTESRGGAHARSLRGWHVALTAEPSADLNTWGADVIVHIHPPDGRRLSSSTKGVVTGQTVHLRAGLIAANRQLEFEVR
jgi:hypothetical protein